ncbi:dihydropteroate synthase [Nocardioides sp. R-C-SC26]|uniref:dihydropteroate synthase n=1 Tax=Nocardioides sp. R-C-SC26 TaxID=2870414 RepID=UPI001E55F5B1|nr:dihydropteroate synthase [Nocardioides sp. R-C-SC26]
MGVVNVTPDSFSDGGRYASTETAIAHGRRLLADGADLLDVGGESTRPGATRPVVAEELARVIPVISGLVAAGAVVSVDTMRAEVAAAALDAGAVVVNDVSGGLADPAVLDVVAGAGATYVAMHWRGHSDRMQQQAVYAEPDGVAGAVRQELAERVAAATSAGIAPERLVLDPGLGFAKTAQQNWELIAGLDELASLGRPLLVGASRKSFIGALLATPDGAPRPVEEREVAGHALTVLLAQRGVWGVRVHDVRGTRDVLAVWQRMHQEQGRGGSPR